MNRVPFPSFIAAACLTIALCGCESYRNGVRSVGSSLGAIGTRDLQHAQVARENLPRELGLPAKQIKIEPGSGVIHVRISGVPAGPDQERIGILLKTLNEKNPHLNPMEWRFE